jgi:hypothetical protein
VTHPAPPRPWLIAYRVLGLRLPPEYRAWAAADTQSKSFLNWRIARTALWLYAGLAVYYVVQSATFAPPGKAKLVQSLLVITAVALLSSKNTLVRKTLRWQRVDRHGRPVAPKRLAILDNREALVGGAAVAVLVASVMAVYANGLRPTGTAAIIKSIKCRTPGEDTLGKIRAGLKSADTTIVTPQSIEFQHTTIVASYYRVAGEPRDRAAIWVVDGDTVYELRTDEQAKDSPTTFDKPPNLDRVVPDAFARVVKCLTDKRRP